MTSGLDQTTKPHVATAELRVLATTDVHMHLRPYDYFADAPSSASNLARLAPQIRAARNEVANCLLVDNGDFLQGTPVSDMIAEPDADWPTDQPHPAIAAMNALGYDAGTLGNHEFNFGLVYLRRALAAAHHKIVLSNVSVSDGGAPVAQKSTLIKRTINCRDGAQHEIQVGIIGLTPPQVLEWDARHLRGKVTVMPIIESARQTAKSLRHAGADVVVALCHSGIGHDQSVQRGEDVGLALARQSIGIDALVLGHSHLLFPNHDIDRQCPDADNRVGQLAKVACVMAGANASHLGVIDLSLEQTETGWRVTEGSAHLRPISQNDREDPAVMKATETGHERTLAYIRRPVGTSDAPLHTFFAALGHDPATALVAGAKLAVARKALFGTHHEGKPLLAAVAPFKAGGRGGPANFTSIEPGALAYKHVADLYHYPNTITALEVSGATLRDWLERAAGLFAQIDTEPSGIVPPLINPHFPVYNFDTLFGVSYKIDLSKPSRFDTETGAIANHDAHRICDLAWNGKPISDDQVFVVATNNYRAGGGGSFSNLAQSETVMATDQTTRDAILDFLQIPPAQRLQVVSAWSFVPLGVSAWFETSPEARAHIPNGLSDRLHDLGDQANGFARFEFSL